MMFRIQCNKVDEHLIGKLCMLIDADITATLKPPAMQDGRQAERPEPARRGRKAGNEPPAAPIDATQAFLASSASAAVN